MLMMRFSLGVSFIASATVGWKPLLSGDRLPPVRRGGGDALDAGVAVGRALPARSR
jgi:hypothetical protein